MMAVEIVIKVREVKGTMKCRLVILNIIGLLLGAFLYTGAFGVERTDWKVLQEDSYHNTFSYDAASVKRAADNVVRVSAKSNGAEYLYEIDCKNKKARILEGAGSAATDWFPIMSGSSELLLSDTLCP